MTDHQENQSQASPESKVEDLAPTEEQSADLKGGPIYMHGGGGAGHSATGGAGAG
jgi:hypothetical protein